MICQPLQDESFLDHMNTDSHHFRINQRKILKWVFLLLQQHHQRLGLKACAWSGPAGINIDRISFFFHSVRDPESPLPGIPLTDMCIYQASLGVCNGINEHPDQHSRELRTNEIVPWLEQQLGVIQRYHQLCASHVFPVQTNVDQNPFQMATWVAKADAYLLSWNVFGHWCRHQAKRVMYYSLGTFPWNLEQPSWIEPARQMFAGTVDPFDILVLLKPDSWLPSRYWLMTGNVVDVNGSALDLNVLSRRGLDSKKIAQLVDSAFPSPVRLHDE